MRFSALTLVVLLTGSGWAAASEISRQAVKQGVARLAKQDFAKALASFDAAEKEDPSDPEPLFFKGVALSRLGRYAQALDRLDQAAKRGYKHPDMDFERGWALLELKRWQDAASSLEQYEHDHPGRGQASEFLGRAYLGLGKRDWAKAKLNQAAKEDPSVRPIALVYLSQIAQSENQPQAAQQNALMLLRDWPRSPLADLLRSRIEESGYVVPQVQAPKPWWLTASAVGGYNNNVISLGSSIPLPTDITHRDDYFANFTFGAGYGLNLTDVDSVALSYNFQSSVYKSIGSASEDHYWSVNLTHFFTPKLSGSLQGGDELTQVSGKKFKSEVGARPSLDYRWTPLIVTEVSSNFTSSNYFTPVNPTQNRNANTSVLNVTQYYTPSETQLNIRAAYSHTWNRAKGSDFVFEADAYDLSLAHPLFLDILGSFSYTKQYTNYLNPNSLAGTGFGFNRTDDLDSVNVSLQRPLLPWLAVVATYTYTKNNSNIAFFNYVQKAVSGGLSARL